MLLNPLMDKVGNLIPGVIGALLVLVIGWLIAIVFKKLIYMLLHKFELDKKVNKPGESKLKIEKGLSKLVFYLVMFYVLLLVLNIMGIQDALAPLNDMLRELMAFLPNLIAAIIIIIVGYVIAKIVSEAVGLIGASLENMATKIGMKDKSSIVSLAKQIIFIFIFIPILIVALDALQMEAISNPATEMLATFLSAIPKIIGAAIVFLVFYLVAKFIVPIIKDLLKNLGFDTFPQKMGITNIIGEKSSLSNIVGNLVFFFIIFAGLISTIEMIELNLLSVVLTKLLEITGQIFFGLIILALGFFVSKLVYKALSSAEGTKGIAGISQFATLIIFLAIGLRSMGIANDIVNLAFGLIFGAVAVAIALSFGLGGREAAGKQMDHILKKFRKDN